MQHKKPTFKRVTLSVACSLALVGCGGGGTTSTASTPAVTTPAVTTPVSVIGRITAFGSIYVNGVRYEIDNASLTSDGPDGSTALNESDLKIGMVVNLTGSRTGTSGTATSVSYNELIEAPVTSVAIDASGSGTLVAGGKTVNVSNTTIFYGGNTRSSISEIVAGDWIEVSGFVGSDGTIDATMISYETESSHGNRAEFEGLLGNLDEVAQTFTLNGVTVDYSSAVMPSVTLVNGMLVEVYGTLDTTTNTLTASHIEPEHSSNDLDDDHSSSHDDDHEYELQGIISGAITGQFTLAGVTVLYNGTTRFEGLTAEQIQDGLLLEVEGQYNAQGQFVAREIELEHHSINGDSDDYHSSNELEIESTVSAIDTANNTLTIMGYTVAISATTILKDDDHGEYYFNINSLSVGDYVEAVLLKNADNSYSLRKLEREGYESLSSIEGVVAQVNADGSVVLGSTTVILPAGHSVSVGQKIEVDGIFDESSQIFTASRFEYDD